MSESIRRLRGMRLKSKDHEKGGRGRLELYVSVVHTFSLPVRMLFVMQLGADLMQARLSPNVGLAE